MAAASKFDAVAASAAARDSASAPAGGAGGGGLGAELKAPGHTPGQKSFSTAKQDVEGDVFKLTITLFTTLHYEALCKAGTGNNNSSGGAAVGNPVKDTLELLFQFAGLNQETLNMARVILISTFIKLAVRMKDFTNGCDYTVATGYDSFNMALTAVEDFLFFMPIRLATDSEVEGLHYEIDPTTHATVGLADLPLLDKVLETVLVFFPESSRGDSAIDPKAPALEKRIKKRGQDSYYFFHDIRLLFRKFNKTTPEQTTERQVVVDDLNSLLNKRVQSGAGFLEVWPDRMKVIRMRLPPAGAAAQFIAQSGM